MSAAYGAVEYSVSDAAAAMKDLEHLQALQSSAEESTARLLLLQITVEDTALVLRVRRNRV